MVLLCVEVDCDEHQLHDCVERLVKAEGEGEGESDG
jgi:hypothetical protein